MRENDPLYKAIFRFNYEEIQRKLHAEIKTLDYYDDSGIGNLANNEDSGEIQPKDKKRKRRRGSRTTRHEETESDHSSESEQTKSDADDGASDSDAGASATAESCGGDQSEVDDKGSDASESHESHLNAVDSLEFYNVDGSGDVSRSRGKSEADSHSDNSGAQADAAVITHEKRSQVARELECSQQLSARLETLASANIEGTVAHIDSDPALPTSGPSTDDTARGDSSKKNGDRNDEETDLIQGFLEQEEDDEDDRESIDHPFPNPNVLTDNDAQKASRWKLYYMWHLLKTSRWRDSEVTGPA
jgi:hypothetical protein